MIHYQHGDLLLSTVEGLPAGCTVIHDGPGAVLAEGELTGHAHRVKQSGTLLRAIDGTVYLKLDAPADLTHEEHKTIHLVPAIYEVKRVQEYDYLAMQARTVAD